MGQKVNPIGIRLGIVQDWKSKWYAKGRKFAQYLRQDRLIRDYIETKLKEASVSKVKIERPARNIKVTICSARPGVLIGKKGGGVDEIRTRLTHMLNVPVHVTVEEIKKPDLEAKLVAESIAGQLERRVMFRRAMKRSMQTVMKAGALGVRIAVSGRLGGAEIARIEWAKEGRIPLHTFRADIDYSTARALTTYGIIGVKVWIYRSEIIGSTRKMYQKPATRGTDTTAKDDVQKKQGPAEG